MITLDEARSHILGACRPLPARGIALEEALGRVISEPVVATEDVPPFANTAMDGYAVRAADTAGPPVTLVVTATLKAGAAADREVGPGEAIRIMTGAPIPPGADAIVMVERTRAGGGATTGTTGTTVIVDHAAAPGDHVRPAGDDIRAGQVVFEPGTVLGPAHLGVLASIGQQRVAAVPAARVGVLATGDELVDEPIALRPGQVRDANRPALVALLVEAGCHPVDLGVARDDEDAIATAVEQGLAGCDALITSGGVSVGDFDYVKSVLDRLGTMNWWQVAIRPAKPLAFGMVAGKPVFGLPGNPVSSLVSFELFARPALRRMMGHRDLLRPEIVAVADEALKRAPDGKTHFQRVVATAADDGRFHVRSSGGQGSHQLRAAAMANALAVLPDGSGVEAGADVAVMVVA